MPVLSGQAGMNPPICDLCGHLTWKPLAPGEDGGPYCSNPDCGNARPGGNPGHIRPTLPGDVERRMPPKGRLDDDQRQRMAEYLPLALSAATPHKRNWPALAEEIDTTALLALAHAAKRFDPAKGTMAALFRSRFRWSMATLFASPIGCFCCEMPRVDLDLDRLPDPREIGADDFDSLVAPLPDLYREVLRLTYRDGLGPTAIGKRLGLYPMQVCGIRDCCLQFLRQSRTEPRP